MIKREKLSSYLRAHDTSSPKLYKVDNSYNSPIMKCLDNECCYDNLTSLLVIWYPSEAERREGTFAACRKKGQALQPTSLQRNSKNKNKTALSTTPTITSKISQQAKLAFVEIPQYYHTSATSRNQSIWEWPINPHINFYVHVYFCELYKHCGRLIPIGCSKFHQWNGNGMGATL